MERMAPVLEVRSLVKDYKKIIGRGKNRVLNGISFTVNEGDLFGLIGPNGAGKTTLIKIILNLINPTSGLVTVLGEPVSRVAVRRRLGYVPEFSTFYPFLSGLETLEFFGKLSGLSGKELSWRSYAVLDRVHLGESAHVPVRYYSKGMQQRLSLAQALLHDPEFLVFDEPASGLDPLARVEVREILLKLREDKKTVFFSSHELSEVETLCTHVALLKDGEIKKMGSLDQLLGLREGHKESLEQFFVRMMREGAA
jgi:ABC-2 type transport system ATP-binding protein